jgi:hypothetical protein
MLRLQEMMGRMVVPSEMMATMREMSIEMDKAGRLLFWLRRNLALSLATNFVTCATLNGPLATPMQGA